MCVFSGRHVDVYTTNIFARRRGDRQLLVYAMQFDAPAAVAMILPLPVAPSHGEHAIRFIDLSPLPDFFTSLDRCFLQAVPLAAAARPQGAGTLAVHRVGAFEASYVPSQADFVRVDPRFRLADSVWRALPMYHDWGFAVFRLQPGRQDVHPMALDFPARLPDALYFPTVHVHDGTVATTASFNHSLYLQGPAHTRYLEHVLGVPQPHGSLATTAPPVATVADTVAGAHLFGPLARELLDLDAPAQRLKLSGTLANADVWLAADVGEPVSARIRTYRAPTADHGRPIGIPADDDTAS